MLRRMTNALRLFLSASLGLLLALVATATDFAGRAHALEQPEGTSGFLPKPLAKAKTRMLIAANPLAAEAGLAILRKGGSAIDAGITTQMVLNLVEPQSSGIGGGASTGARRRPLLPRQSFSSTPRARRCRATPPWRAAFR
jgi:hypothetical protein